MLFAPLPLTALLLLWRPWKPQIASAFALVFAALYPPLALATVVFGDGFADTAKQFHLGMTVLLAFWLLFVAALVERGRALRSATSSGVLVRSPD